MFALYFLLTNLMKTYVRSHSKNIHVTFTFYLLFMFLYKA